MAVLGSAGSASIDLLHVTSEDKKVITLMSVTLLLQTTVVVSGYLSYQAQRRVRPGFE